MATRTRRGRPSQFERSRAQVISALRAGATDEVAGSACDPPVTGRTVHAWKQAHPDFREECAAAKEYADGKIQASLYRLATGGAISRTRPVLHPRTKQPILGPDRQVLLEVEYFAPNVVGAIFWLKNRDPERWKDRHDVDLGDKPLRVQIVEGDPEDPGAGPAE